MIRGQKSENKLRLLKSIKINFFISFVVKCVRCFMPERLFNGRILNFLIYFLKINGFMYSKLGMRIAFN